MFRFQITMNPGEDKIFGKCKKVRVSVGNNTEASKLDDRFPRIKNYIESSLYLVIYVYLFVVYRV